MTRLKKNKIFNYTNICNKNLGSPKSEFLLNFIWDINENEDVVYSHIFSGSRSVFFLILGINSCAAYIDSKNKIVQKNYLSNKMISVFQCNVILHVFDALS